MKQVMYEDCNNNIPFIKEIFRKISFMGRNGLIWSISNLDMIPSDTEDYSGVGGIVNSSRERVYQLQQRIMNEHTISIEHNELMLLFDDVRTIYEGTFAAVINGHLNEILIFDGDIVKIQGEIEKIL